MIRDVSFAFHIPATSLLKLFSILPRHDLQSLFAHSGQFVKTVSNALRKLFAILYLLYNPVCRIAAHEIFQKKFKSPLDI